MQIAAHYKIIIIIIIIIIINYREQNPTIYSQQHRVKVATEKTKKDKTMVETRNMGKKNYYWKIIITSSKLFDSQINILLFVLKCMIGCWRVLFWMIFVWFFSLWLV